MIDNKSEMIANAAEKMTYGSAGTALVFGLSSNEIMAIAALGGFAVAILTYLTTTYFNYKRLQILKKNYENDNENDS